MTNTLLCACVCVDKRSYKKPWIICWRLRQLQWPNMLLFWQKVTDEGDGPLPMGQERLKLNPLCKKLHPQRARLSIPKFTGSEKHDSNFAFPHHRFLLQRALLQFWSWKLCGRRGGKTTFTAPCCVWEGVSNLVVVLMPCCQNGI